MKPQAGRTLPPSSALFVFPLVDFLFTCLLFAFVLVEEGVQDLQGGRDVQRDNICHIIHRIQLVFIIHHRHLPSYRGSENLKMLLPTLANKYSHNPSLKVIDQEDKNNIRWKFNQYVLGEMKSRQNCAVVRCTN